MNALIEQPTLAAAPDADRRTVFLPELKARFLEHLASFGNVAQACVRAGVSRQTAYRERRRDAAFAQFWDAALLAARSYAEDELADRALHGVEEAIYYHGEEVGRRRRFSDRLLLAHLARLDRMAERQEASAALGVLDDAIDALARGEAVEAPQVEGADDAPCGRDYDPYGRVPPVPHRGEQAPICPDCGNPFTLPGAEQMLDNCWCYDNRVGRMEAARPAGATAIWAMHVSEEERARIEALQLNAFEADGHEWWRVTDEETFMASVIYGHEDEVEDGDRDGENGGG